jgi:hypothetical protein
MDNKLLTHKDVVINFSHYQIVILLLNAIYLTMALTYNRSRPQTASPWEVEVKARRPLEEASRPLSPIEMHHPQ